MMVHLQIKKKKNNCNFHTHKKKERENLPKKIINFLIQFEYGERRHRKMRAGYLTSSNHLLVFFFLILCNISMSANLLKYISISDHKNLAIFGDTKSIDQFSISFEIFSNKILLIKDLFRIFHHFFSKYLFPLIYFS